MLATKNQQEPTYSYIQIPSFLIHDSRFNDLTNDAKMLYAFLFDRYRLSKKNNQSKQWEDEKGIFVLFTREEMAQKLNCSVRKVFDLFCQLKIKNLIDEKRMGLGRANRIYVKIPASSLKKKSASTRKATFAGLDRQKLPSNKRLINNSNKKVCSHLECVSSNTIKKYSQEDIEIIIHRFK